MLVSGGRHAAPRFHLPPPPPNCACSACICCCCICRHDIAVFSCFVAERSLSAAFFACAPIAVMTDASESRSAAQPQPVPDGALAAFAAKVASAFACASEGGASTESPSELLDRRVLQQRELLHVHGLEGVRQRGGEVGRLRLVDGGDVVGGGGQPAANFSAAPASSLSAASPRPSTASPASTRLRSTATSPRPPASA